MATKFQVNILLCCWVMAINMSAKWPLFWVMLSPFKNVLLKTQIDIFFVIYLEMILIHAYITFHILNFGSCIMKINNIWRKLWLNNIKRCFWQIFKISGHAYVLLHAWKSLQTNQFTNSYCFVRLILDQSLKYQHILAFMNHISKNEGIEKRNCARWLICSVRNHGVIS